MSSMDPREREDLCGRTLVPRQPGEDLAEEYDPDTWYESENGTHYCCRQVWSEADSDRCIWHADVSDKPAEVLAANRSQSPARLDRAVLRESVLRDEIPLSSCRIPQAELGNVGLQEADLCGANLVDANLNDANLRAADLSETNLRRANLGGANLRNANLYDATLRGAKLGDTILRDADFGDATIRHADLRGAVLVNADLSGAALRGADLSGADLRRIDLNKGSIEDAELADSNLWNADLAGATIRNSHLDNTKLQDADLRGADFEGAGLTGADLQDSLLSDATFRGANLTGVNLERAQCSRVNLFDADLSGASLYGAILSNLQFNTKTAFGDHYTDDSHDPDPDKAAWTLRQLERLFRENALPGKAREAYLDRKDRRRRQYWRQAFVPGLIRRVVAAGKSGWRRFRHGAGRWLKARINGSDGADDGEVEEETDAADEASTAAADDTEDDGDEHVSTDTMSDAAYADLSRWERLVATVRWAHAAGAGVTTRYGERPWRVVGVSLVVIGASTVAYKLFGPLVRPPGPDDPVMVGGDLAGAVSMTPPGWLAEWLTSLYFSVVTFTTLGYGDLRPASGMARAVATVESFVGALLMALLVFVLGRRATW